MESSLNDIRKILKKNPAKALELVNLEINKNSGKNLLMLRSEIYQATNENTKAINDYIEILKVYGADEEVENRKKLLETIVGMTQLDVFACTNLHKDPWD